MGDSKNLYVSILLAVLTVTSGIATILSSDTVVRGISVAVILISIIVVLFRIIIKRFANKVPKEGMFSHIYRAPYRLELATEDDLWWIAETSKKVYSGIDVIPYEIIHEWYAQNPACFHVVKDRLGQICGNIDVLPLKKSVMDLFISGKMIELDIKGEHLLAVDECDKTECLYVESVVTIGERQSGNPLATHRILRDFEKIVKDIGAVNLKRVYAIAASKKGKSLLQNLGFNQINGEHLRKDQHALFMASYIDLANNIANTTSDEERKKIMKLIRRINDQSL